MKNIAAIITTLLLFLSIFSPCQTPEKRICLAQKLAVGMPFIDGALNEACWETALWENGFIQNKPWDGLKATQETFFAVLFDDDFIYVGMKMRDSAPDSIVQRLTRRDSPDGDIAGIEIDSYNDHRSAFAFTVSAAGVMNDFFVSEDGSMQDATWNPVWWAATSKDSMGWYAEMKIPFTQIRFKKSRDQEWGFQAVRYLFRKDESSLWQPVSRKQSGFVSFFGKIKGFTGIKPAKTTDITPYTVTSIQRFEKVNGNPFLEKGHTEKTVTGLDAKIGLTNNLTLDMTVNPDFGQVEADPSEVNLSTFETFFKEQRPFFVEGKNILEYKVNFGDGDDAREGLFYSRRIGRSPHYIPDNESGTYVSTPKSTRILEAAKITGKTSSGWSVGLLESVTAKEVATIKGPSVEKIVAVEPFTVFSVGRLQKDFNDGNTYVGGMFTAVNRNLREEQFDFLHKSAYSGGLDLVHKWHNKDWQLEASLFGSRVSGSSRAITLTQESWPHLFQRPDAVYLHFDTTLTSLSGYGGKIMIGQYGGNLKFNTALSLKSPGLELNDAGYMREANTILQSCWTGYFVYKPFFIFNELYVNFSQWSKWDYSRTAVGYGLNMNSNVVFRNYWTFGITADVSDRYISVSSLRGGPTLTIPAKYNLSLSAGSNNQKKLTFELYGFTSRSFIRSYALSEGITLEMDYQPIKQIKLSLAPDYNFDTYELQYVTQDETGGNVRYIFSTIKRNTLGISLRANINFSPVLSLQFWGQPFIASGEYSHFKRITDTKAKLFGETFREYTGNELLFDNVNETYNIQEKGYEDFSFGKPDFNIKYFLSNTVVRWEYQPGSTLYFVWSQNRYAWTGEGSFEPERDMHRLFKMWPENTYLLKLSYRIEAVRNKSRARGGHVK